jgi:nucleotide-binding universal stress UspA family protein
MARRPARRAGGKRFRHILHASDFSPASRRAFDTALRLAKVDGATLILVHVLEPAVPWVEVDYASPRAYKLIASARNAAAKRLDALVRKAKAAGVRSVGRLVDGNPRDVILSAAKRLHADLVVVGTHGRTGLDKLLVGSVAERVVAMAPCPVLTVRRR